MGCEVAGAGLGERIKWERSLKIAASLCEDAAAFSALRKFASGYLTVEVKGKPTKHFHNAATISENEQALMLALSELVRPYKASIKRAKS